VNTLQIRWTKTPANNIRKTLAYWHEHNDSFAYSEKILDETEKAEKAILDNPYRKQEYSELLNLYRRYFFKGKFVLYYRIDELANIIWITNFRSAKQKPLF
jgi:putative plasmid stabilization system